MAATPLQFDPSPVPHAEAAPAAPLICRDATVEDVDAIHALITEAARSTTVLPRDRDNISRVLRDFLVVTDGERLLGCGALTLFSGGLAEIRSLVVAPDLRGHGIGGLLVRDLVEEGRRIGIRRIFALTDNPPFFARHGFKIVDKLTLPQKVWTDCINCPLYLHCAEEAVEMVL